MIQTRSNSLQQYSIDQEGFTPKTTAPAV